MVVKITSKFGRFKAKRLMDKTGSWGFPLRREYWGAEWVSSSRLHVYFENAGSPSFQFETGIHVKL